MQIQQSKLHHDYFFENHDDCDCMLHAIFFWVGRKIADMHIICRYMYVSRRFCLIRHLSKLNRYHEKIQSKRLTVQLKLLFCVV